jgi:hypothetical protein
MFVGEFSFYGESLFLLSGASVLGQVFSFALGNGSTVGLDFSSLSLLLCATRCQRTGNLLTWGGML